MIRAVHPRGCCGSGGTVSGWRDEEGTGEWQPLPTEWAQALHWQPSGVGTVVI